MNFQIHPSQDLVNLFVKQPYQGQSPETAEVVFLSSDANYPKELNAHSFFEFILEYQKDGIEFWKKHGCHHPFLLKEFPFNKTSGGRPYHKNFSNLGLDSSYAKHISFLELLDVPTIGNKSENYSLFYSMANINHLEYIDKIIQSDSSKLIFVSKGVLKDMLRFKKEFTVFSWLDYKKGKPDKYEKQIHGNIVQEIYHFSSSHVYGQLNQIRYLIDSWLK